MAAPMASSLCPFPRPNHRARGHALYPTGSDAMEDRLYLRARTVLKAALLTAGHSEARGPAR